MPSSILNSDDGVISGTSGLKSSGGDDGSLAVQSNGTEVAKFKTTELVINDGGANYDFRVEGDTNANLLFVDASADRVGIGTSSPAALLHVSGSTAGIRVERPTTADAGIRFKTTLAEFVVGAGIGSETNCLNFYDVAAGAERMRIDSSGNLLVGTTTSAGIITAVSASLTTATASFDSSGASNFQRCVITKMSGRSPNDASSYFLAGNDTTATRYIMYSNGGLHNYSANNSNLSDRREKTNFAPAKNYLETICSIPVQTFNYIDQNNEDDPGLTLGVVAQDVQEVAPELVMESNWAGKDEEPKMRLSIYQTDLQYALMKCIQELSAKNDALEARIAALEAVPGNE
jgi:hypothetical protein